MECQTRRSSADRPTANCCSLTQAREPGRRRSDSQQRAVDGPLGPVQMETAASATQEAAFPKRGGVMTMCDGDDVRVYAADNAGANATAEYVHLS